MIRRARLDTTMSARVVARTPLRYREGADVSQDRPEHVRAGSGLAWHGGRLALVQDDASFVAFIDVARGDGAGPSVTALALPRGEGGRRLFGDDLGNKRFKLDLEACVSFVDPREEPVLMAFGSGSGEAHARDHVVMVRGERPTARDVRVVDARRLYDRLRALTSFAGSELNVEGAVLRGDVLTLFQRGNGSARGPLTPVNATCEVSLGALLAFLEEPDVAEVPVPVRIAQYELGVAGGGALSFTDAAYVDDELWYLAAAEASPDAVTDGVVTGVAIGRLGEGDGVRCAIVQNEQGAPLCDKVEGLAPCPGEPGRFYGAVDCDDPVKPSELVVIEVTEGGPR